MTKPARRKRRVKSAIHARIRQRREMKKLTMEQLGALLDVDKSAICHWERGDFGPSRKYLPSLAAALDLTVEELCDEAA